MNKKQQGAALIISLIILAVLTIIGVVSMQSTGLELKMISSTHDRNVAFESVETALIKIEHSLDASPPIMNKLYSSCTGSGCFNRGCDEGYCFAGKYTVSDEKQHCVVANAVDDQHKDFWEDENLKVWEDQKKHKVITIAGLKTPVKYIVEFLCFSYVGKEFGVGFSTQGSSSEISENENYNPLYRITAMAIGNANRATVVLQTTYRIAK